MKAEMILKPLAFAMAVALSTSAVANGYNQQDGASATITDSQINKYNDVDNEATKNNATVNGSLNGTTGNIGANVAAGDNNQQANAAAIATADAAFVWGRSTGEAHANVDVTQKGHDNTVYNEATQNNATVLDSGNEIQGNVGINVAAGTSNQQKNDMAVASSEKALEASADVTVYQESEGNYTDNAVGRVYEVGQEMSVVASGFGWHPWPGKHHDKTPVVNNATLDGSLNDVSGNVGVNIAAGSGNQQSNSLSIAAGCNACQ